MKLGRRSHPLRKVSARQFDYGDFGYHGQIDMLECGHIIPTPQDIAGNYYPEKRRCHKCTKGKDQDFNPNLTLKE